MLEEMASDLLIKKQSELSSYHLHNRLPWHIAVANPIGQSGTCNCLVVSIRLKIPVGLVLYIFKQDTA